MSFWLTIYLTFILLLCFIIFELIKNFREEEKNLKFEKRLKEIKKKSLNENIKEFFGGSPEAKKFKKHNSKQKARYLKKHFHKK